MKTRSTPDPGVPRKVAFFWDESLLWGLMAYKMLKSEGLPFDLIDSHDIRSGGLDACAALFVPGGWAAHKIERLGDEGVAAIRRFVEEGGNYLGICGGAGLATAGELGITAIRRKPAKERVPSFSGRIRVDLKDHPIWHGLGSHVFHAWWPSQFSLEGADVKVLAEYGEAMPDSYSSDVCVGEASRRGMWGELESAYGILLNPERLRGEPAVVESALGKGKVVLSLVHFDTPGDVNGALVMRNLWTYLGGEEALTRAHEDVTGDPVPPGGRLGEDIARLESDVGALIEKGIRNSLWFTRNDFLLQWRRGVRGLEYCTLYQMIREIRDAVWRNSSMIIEDSRLGATVGYNINMIRDILHPFLEDSMKLIEAEGKGATQGMPAAEIKALKNDLFSNLKRHGGRFRILIGEVDKVVFMLLKAGLGKRARDFRNS